MLGPWKQTRPNHMLTYESLGTEMARGQGTFSFLIFLMWSSVSWWAGSLDTFMVLDFIVWTRMS